MMRTLLLTGAMAVAAVAADPAARLSSPLLGYVFDANAKAVRPITGIPGAASLEAPVPSASKLQIGFVSPNRQWLLAVLLEGGAGLLNLRTGETVALDGAPQDAALGAWSSDGTSAALWSRAGVLQVWTGLPASPTLSFSQTAEAAAGIALADGGASALVWSDTGLLAVDANGIRALHTEPVSAAAYRAGSSDWAAVTPTQLLRSTVEPRPLTVSGPGAVAFSQEAVLVAGKGAVEVIGESSASVPCECDGTSLEPLAGTNIFRLTDLQAPSLAVYDGSEAEPRILYIPSEGRRQ